MTFLTGNRGYKLLVLNLLAINIIFIYGLTLGADMSTPETDLPGYCNETAEMSGIQDNEEKKQYFRICMESYGEVSEIQEPSDSSTQNAQ